MNRHLLWIVVAALSVTSALGTTYHRSFRNGYPSGAQGVSGGPVRTVGVTTNVVKLSGGFAKFRNKSWVTGMGTVTQVLDDDLEPPCHQRFILSDGFGHKIQITNNIDNGRERLVGVKIGDTVAFKGEFISTPEGGVVHWTHPDSAHRKPGGWVKMLKSAKTPVGFAPSGSQPKSVGDTRTNPGERTKATETKAPVEAAEVAPPDERKEYFAGHGPMATRAPAPVNDDWPETGYWLSTNSGARHNKRCENYRKTRGYPCKKTEGRPCGKCGG